MKYLTFPTIRWTLQINILIAFSTLLVVTVAIIVGYIYQQNTKAVLQLSDDLVSEVTETVMERTMTYLAPAADMAELSTTVPTLNVLNLVDNVPLERYGMGVLAQYPQLAGFFIGTEQGNFLFVKRFPDGSIGTERIDRTVDPPTMEWRYRHVDGRLKEVEVTEEVTYDPRQRPWYIGAQEAQDSFWTSIYIFFTDQKPGITAAYPIMDEEGMVQGVIGVDVALEALSEFLKTQQIGTTGVVFIVNRQGEMVAYPDIPLATAEGESFRPIHISELTQPGVAEAFAKYQANHQARFTFELAEETYIGSFTDFPAEFGRDWQVGIVVPKDDFLRTLQQTNQVSLLISLAILIVAIIMAIFIARSISQPIELLTEETRKIKDFELDSELVIRSPIHEVQLLGDSIIAMRSSLKTFQKYVPAELVREAIKTGEVARLGGHSRELTIFFSDVAGFTTISEQMEPEALMLQLSDYLGSLATIINQEHGTVDKYMGDGLMAFWGAPLPNADHAYNACLAALRCQQRVAALNEAWQKEGKPAFKTRIGLHTGDTLVGNMGSQERMNYTVLGDGVNLASRLEPLNKLYGTSIIVSAATYQKVIEQFYFRPLDIVAVKGKQRGVMIYELMGFMGELPSEILPLMEQFTHGFDAYLAQDWARAVAIFQQLTVDYPDDGASKLYLSRCQGFRENPPGLEWRPIIQLDSKG